MSLKALTTGWLMTAIVFLLIGKGLFYIAALMVEDRTKVLEMYNLYRIATFIIVMGVTIWLILT